MSSHITRRAGPRIPREPITPVFSGIGILVAIGFIGLVAIVFFGWLAIHGRMSVASL